MAKKDKDEMAAQEMPQTFERSRQSGKRRKPKGKISRIRELENERRKASINNKQQKS